MPKNRNRALIIYSPPPIIPEKELFGIGPGFFFGPSGATVGARFKDFPSEFSPGPTALGGQVVMRTTGNKKAAAALKSFPVRVKSALGADLSQKATNLQASLQAALLGDYRRAATGRFARSIRVTPTRGVGPGGKIVAGLQIKAIPYRETKFLTNLGGSGRFKNFPVKGYRIWAKGARAAFRSLPKPRADYLADEEPRSIQSIIRGIKASDRTPRGVPLSLSKNPRGVRRLKIPRSGNFFTAGRRPGRGGGEQRFLTSAIGPFEPGDDTSGAFFYPLWVNHPGFTHDFLYERAVLAGSTYIAQSLETMKEAATSFKRDTKGRSPKELTGTSFKTTSPEATGFIPGGTDIDLKTVVKPLTVFFGRFSR